MCCDPSHPSSGDVLEIGRAMASANVCQGAVGAGGATFLRRHRCSTSPPPENLRPNEHSRSSRCTGASPGLTTQCALLLFCTSEEKRTAAHEYTVATQYGIPSAIISMSRLAPFLKSHHTTCKPAEMEKLMENDVFMAFSTYAAIVILKMMLMAPMTAYYRLTRGAFANEEDVSRKPAEERKKLLRAHPDVERVKRCHQNDLENIIPFVVVGLLYALTDPELSTALLHFRLFTGSRIFHTIAYVGALPQPSRGLSWMLGMLVTFSMAYRVLSTVVLL
ncbi:microsomal glutathione S-transferase 1-like protein [Lates japonicus]|uniref:Microsomal glutathione S-transferase 1 n=1 Tax=Lates japonicus TaxID=270547 RepID=A0AAD3RD96_LATJO|nr:microsomal glutathione S-transferase 1-like protein [Lates japonicus]